MVSVCTFTFTFNVRGRCVSFRICSICKHSFYAMLKRYSNRECRQKNIQIFFYIQCLHGYIPKVYWSTAFRVPSLFSSVIPLSTVICCISTIYYIILLFLNLNATNYSRQRNYCKATGKILTGTFVWLYRILAYS